MAKFSRRRFIGNVGILSSAAVLSPALLTTDSQGDWQADFTEICFQMAGDMK